MGIASVALPLYAAWNARIQHKLCDTSTANKLNSTNTQNGQYCKRRAYTKRASAATLSTHKFAGRKIVRKCNLNAFDGEKRVGNASHFKRARMCQPSCELQLQCSLNRLCRRQLSSLGYKCE